MIEPYKIVYFLCIIVVSVYLAEKTWQWLKKVKLFRKFFETEKDRYNKTLEGLDLPTEE